GLNDLLGLCNGRCQELLGDDRLFDLRSAEHDRVMGAGRGRDGDRVDVVGEQLVEVVNEGRPDGLCRGSTASRIVVPSGDELGFWMLADQPGVLGCMHVPESENRYLDRI